MKQLSTLITDVYELLKQRDGWFTEREGEELGTGLSVRFQEKFKEQRAPGLRLSKMGQSCPCALWHSVNAPDIAEALPPWAEFKYRYGDIIETFAITLAKATGHTVTGEQDHVTVDGISGHRDCVIDGCIVDVKSASSQSYLKFKDGSIRTSDSFGYLDQLDGYLLGSADDPLVTVKDRAYLWVIDKQLGHMCLYEHHLRKDSIRNRISESKRIVGSPVPPKCTCGTVAEGAAGNERLDKISGYNPYKWGCKPHVRKFIYAKGPVYLTKVVVRPQPHILEVDRHGKTIWS